MRLAVTPSMTRALGQRDPWSKRRSTSAHIDRHRRWMVAAVLVLTLAPLWSAPGVAGAVDPAGMGAETIEVSGLHFLSDVCGVPIVQSGTISIGSMQLSDGSIEQHIRVDVDLVGNEEVAYERASFTATVDPAAETVTLEGALVSISAPEAGMLLRDVGRIVRALGSGDIQSLAGSWMLLNGQFEEVCSYFGA
jgi:hypothetical protein